MTIDDDGSQIARNSGRGEKLKSSSTIEIESLRLSASYVHRSTTPQLVVPRNLDKALPPLPYDEPVKRAEKKRSACSWLSSLSKTKVFDALPSEGQAAEQNSRLWLFFRKKRNVNVTQKGELKEATTIIKYIGIDKDTQTNPVLVVEKYPVKEASKFQSRIGPNIRPRALRYPSDAESDRGLSSPLWSPRPDASVRHAQDYFVLPRASESDNRLLERPERIPLLHRDGREKPAIAAHRSAPPTPMFNTDRSMDTLATYESRYSSRGSGKGMFQQIHHGNSRSLKAESEIIKKVPAQQDDTIKQSLRTCSSEETVNIRPKLSRGILFFNSSEGKVTDDGPPGVNERTYSPELSPRWFRNSPRLTPLIQMAVQKKRHSNRSQSSEIAQESRRRDQSDDMVDLPTPDEDMVFYNIRLADYPEDVGLSQSQDVPDHFLGSPLCPMHPKHKSGGLGICPLHGRKKTSESLVKSKLSLEDSTKAETPTAGSSNPKEFNLGIPEHTKTDPKCPANVLQESGKYGVCPIHGRGRDRDADKLLRLL